MTKPAKSGTFPLVLSLVQSGASGSRLDRTSVRSAAAKPGKRRETPVSLRLPRGGASSGHARAHFTEAIHVFNGSKHRFSVVCAAIRNVEFTNGGGMSACVALPLF